MIKKEIHLWDLNTSFIYVKLKNGFRENFFNKIREGFLTWKEAGKCFDIKRGDTTLAINWKNGETCCPLNKIFEMADYIYLEKEIIEKNIIEMRFKKFLNKRGGSSGKPIKNPKIPILIDEDFAEILGHICGDGCMKKDYLNKGGKIGYINSEPKLIEDFKNLVKKVFGDIEPYVNIRDERTKVKFGKPRYTKANYYIVYPTILVLVFLSVFKGKEKELELPKEVLYNDSLKKTFIRAIFDDEANIIVKNKKIQVGMISENFVIDLKNMLNDLGLRTTKIMKREMETNLSKNYKYYRFEVLGSESIKKFKEEIGFKHPLKSKRLDEIIENGWKFDRYPNGFFSMRLKELLQEKSLTFDELSKNFNRNKTTLWGHLRKRVDSGELIKNNDLFYLNKGDSFEQK